jgi:hypothetical protein
MNVAYFIFWLLHICNLLTLSILTPLHLPYTPSIDCAHLSVNSENTIDDCTEFSANYAHNFDDFANILDEWKNIDVDLINLFDISFKNLYIPNPTLM